MLQVHFLIGMLSRQIRKVQGRYFHGSCGLVGLPNVGKSTLFNALTKSEQAQAANYPFCTIEPNVAKVAVPDARIDRLGDLANSDRILKSQIELVDIAGLVRGASKGEGLGNQFLNTIRQAAVIVHVVRCFDDTNIIHVDETVDPIRDMDTIQSELVLSDIATVERYLGSKKYAKEARRCAIYQSVLDALENGEKLPSYTDSLETGILNEMNLLTAKKMIYLCNVSEDDAACGNAYTKTVQEYAGSDHCLIVSGSLEESAIGLEDAASQKEYLDCFGLSETGLSKLLKTCFHVLGLQTYYTVGKKEAKSWHIPKHSTAPVAAGKIHSDFERLFIRAETIDYDKMLLANGCMKKAKELGYVRTEGKDYICQDGDVFNFLIGK